MQLMDWDVERGERGDKKKKRKETRNNLPTAGCDWLQTVAS